MPPTNYNKTTKIILLDFQVRVAVTAQCIYSYSIPTWFESWSGHWTEDFHCFTQFLQANAGMVSTLGTGHDLIIHNNLSISFGICAFKNVWLRGLWIGEIIRGSVTLFYNLYQENVCGVITNDRRTWLDSQLEGLLDHAQRMSRTAIGLITIMCSITGWSWLCFCMNAVANGMTTNRPIFCMVE